MLLATRWTEPDQRAMLAAVAIGVGVAGTLGCALWFRYVGRAVRPGGHPAWWLAGAVSVISIGITGALALLVGSQGLTSWATTIGITACWLLIRFAAVRLLSRSGGMDAALVT